MSAHAAIDGAPAEGWIVGYRGTCYPADCDHMGHMNGAAYVKKFDEATWFLRDAVGLSAHRMVESRHGLAALESAVQYERDVFPGRSRTVRFRILEVGNKTARVRRAMSVSRPDGLRASLDARAAAGAAGAVGA